MVHVLSCGGGGAFAERRGKWWEKKKWKSFQHGLIVSTVGRGQLKADIFQHSHRVPPKIGVVVIVDDHTKMIESIGVALDFFECCGPCGGGGGGRSHHGERRMRERRRWWWRGWEEWVRGGRRS